MSLPGTSLDLAFGYAGIGRWDYAPDSAALLVDETCRALFEIAPDAEVTQKLMRQRISEEDRARVFSAIAALKADGDVFEEVFRLALPSGAQRWVRSVARLGIRDGKPKVTGVSFDVTTEQELLAERALHLAEMNHRIKNLFALVSAMISSASRESEDKHALVENLRGRVTALDRAHSLMKRTDSTQPLGLSALLERVLAPSRTQQTIALSGEEVMIPAKAITSLVLIFHEWATNSAKYGALRRSDGEITVTWTLQADGLHLIWRESAENYDDGAAKGFGSMLIKASAMQLGAEKTRRVQDGWLIIEMTLPLAVLREEG